MNQTTSKSLIGLVVHVASLIWLSVAGSAMAGSSITESDVGSSGRAILSEEFSAELIPGVGLEVMFSGVECIETWRGWYAHTTECTDEDVAKVGLDIEVIVPHGKWFKAVSKTHTRLKVKREGIEDGELVLSVDTATLAAAVSLSREDLGKKGLRLSVTGPFASRTTNLPVLMNGVPLSSKDKKWVTTLKESGRYGSASTLEQYRQWIENPGEWVGERKAVEAPYAGVVLSGAVAGDGVKLPNIPGGLVCADFSKLHRNATGAKLSYPFVEVKNTAREELYTTWLQRNRDKTRGAGAYQRGLGVGTSTPSSPFSRQGGHYAPEYIGIGRYQGFKPWSVTMQEPTLDHFTGYRGVWGSAGAVTDEAPLADWVGKHTCGEISQGSGFYIGSNVLTLNGGDETALLADLAARNTCAKDSFEKLKARTYKCAGKEVSDSRVKQDCISKKFPQETKCGGTDPEGVVTAWNTCVEQLKTSFTYALEGAPEGAQCREMGPWSSSLYLAGDLPLGVNFVPIAVFVPDYPEDWFAYVMDKKQKGSQTVPMKTRARYDFSPAEVKEGF